MNANWFSIYCQARLACLPPHFPVSHAHCCACGGCSGPCMALQPKQHATLHCEGRAAMLLAQIARVGFTTVLSSIYMSNMALQKPALLMAIGGLALCQSLKPGGNRPPDSVSSSACSNLASTPCTLHLRTGASALHVVGKQPPDHHSK